MGKKVRVCLPVVGSADGLSLTMHYSDTGYLPPFKSSCEATSLSHKTYSIITVSANQGNPKGTFAFTRKGKKQY